MFEIKLGDALNYIIFKVDEKNSVIIDRLSNNFKMDNNVLGNDYKNYITEINITGRSNHLHFSPRHLGTSESESLKYVKHIFSKIENKQFLDIVLENDLIGVTVHYEYNGKSKTFKTYTTVKNISNDSISLEYVSILALYGLLGKDEYDDIYLNIPNNGWYNEAQWKRLSLSELGLSAGQKFKTMKRVVINNKGTWSTKCYAPMGILENPKTNSFLIFEIESNNNWSYELGDFYKSVTLSLSGHNFTDDGWIKNLEPNQEFTTFNASFSMCSSLDECMKNITEYRRSIIRKSNDSVENPIIFNEYMFGSWNDPTEETARIYAPYAKETGAEYYVIDCGWHDDEKNPFYHIGKWEESKTRYPNGLKNTLDYIRSLGLKVGLWLEPEVVGTFGDAKSRYSDDLFFKRNGKVVITSDRYQFDFRNKQVIEHLNNVIDRLIKEYDVKYFKFDYNIEVIDGSDVNTESRSEALRQHSEKVIEWIKNIRLKYKDIVIEDCASGGNKLDYLTLSVANLASTSDQVDYTIYPYIVSNILSLVLPEQAGIWSYPVSNVPTDLIDKEKTIMNMTNAMIGRMHLSSELRKLDKENFDLVKEGNDYYKYLNKYKIESYPYFPIGFSKMGDKELCYGLKSDKKVFLFVYTFNGGTKEFRLDLNIKDLKVSYPTNNDVLVNYENGILKVKFTNELQSRIIEIDL